MPQPDMITATDHLPKDWLPSSQPVRTSQEKRNQLLVTSLWLNVLQIAVFANLMCVAAAQFWLVHILFFPL